MYKSQILL